MSKGNTPNDIFWDLEIKPKGNLFSLNLKELWSYRDLLVLFVKRDFTAVYKQTILGPLWYLIQPILTTITFSVVFGNIAKISTDGAPQILFYMSGIICWNYFADCLNNTSTTFVSNAGVFGKVYFPRLISPLAVVLSTLIKFSVQLFLFLGILLYYIFFEHFNFTLQPQILLLPYLVLLMALLGLSLGIIISTFTTKYRDLRFLIGFGVQLLMYATPIIYPLSSLAGTYKTIVLLNPMTPIIEAMKFILIGSGSFNMYYLAYSTLFIFIVFFGSLLLFNKVEKTFMDTV